MTYTDKHEPSGQLAPSLLPRELHVERVSCSWGTCNSNPRVELNHSPLNQHRRRTSSLFLIGAFVSCRIHRLAIFIRHRGWPLPPPLLQTCLLQSSSLLPHVYRRRTVALLRHDAVFFLVFPARRPEDGKLRMLSYRCLFFSDFTVAPQYASPCPKLA